MNAEFEDQSLFTPESLARTKHSFRSPNSAMASPAGGSENSSFSIYMRHTVAESIKIVVFSTKINLLIPFGPLAILVDRFSGHHVSGLFPFRITVFSFRTNQMN